MALRLLLCSLLLMVVLYVKASPVNQQSSSEHLWEIRESTTEHTPSNDTVVDKVPYLKTGKKTYYIETIFKGNWYQALQYCLYHGMQLASIESKEESDALKKCIVDSGYGKEYFWSSGTDLAEEGKFFWMSNGRPFAFHDWGTGEPNNQHGSENCLQIADRGEGIKWNDIPCDLKQYFICEDTNN